MKAPITTTTIVVSALLPGPHLAAVAAETPLVVVGRPESPSPEVGGVANHDQRGAQLVVEHLAALGHRRIAHVTGSDRPAARARRESYATTMATMALREHVRVVPRDHGAALVGEVARGDRSAPTAIFASSDRIAVQVLLSALDAAVSVPDQLSVVGYDTAVARLVRPELTTVNQRRHAMGRRAMAQLAGLITRTTAPQHEVLEPSLVVRGTTAAPGEAT